MVRKTSGVIRLNRRCVGDRFFYKQNATYCAVLCEPITMCGEVQVPEEHLEVCRTCNEKGRNCKERGPDGIYQPPYANFSRMIGGYGRGVPRADFVLYVSAVETKRCSWGSTVAYAAHCQQEATLDRSGELPPRDRRLQVSTVKHEILHALGFSVSLFAFFRDDRGLPLTPRTEHGWPPLNEKTQVRIWSDKVVRKIVREDWLAGVEEGPEEGTEEGEDMTTEYIGRDERRRREGERRLRRVRREMHMVVTDRVVAEARAHFGCPILEGAELEDQGGDGTELTHWEKRVFEDEAMTGLQTQKGSFSRLTLALMEDTGWYRANYSIATPLHWGKGLGCDFAMHSCAEWIKNKRSRVKRNPLRTECTRDRESVALCNLLEFKDPLPTLYQNFDQIDGVEEGREAWYGGSVELADHCPYLQEFVWRSGEQVARSSHCLHEDNNPVPAYNFALESYGEGSQCIDHGGPWEERSCEVRRQWGHWGAGCYKVSCSAGRLHIEIENRTITCYYAGQIVTIRIWTDEWLHKGSLVCPSCKDVCQDELEAIGDRCKDDALQWDDRLKTQILLQQKKLLDHDRCGAVSHSASNVLLSAAAFLVRVLLQR
ncbi:hypothetical protein J437_LFUL007599 [Ladona fulva]|uniref:Leishmanolysin-like peptidase n=1 Tax=Ladona fulva TaxID=123851 RepID=A0A8K0K605_LADFU|nr:hypothetical protein J437_LFUL007599 [Ladona fulva]